MEFLAPTKEALDEYLNPAVPDLETSLMTMGDSAARIVPECVGLSLTLFDQDDLTFTLVAGSLALGDIDDLPPARVEGTGRWDDEDTLLDEERWALFARANAAAGVASTLSLSVVVQDQVVGGINLYASSADAFSGRHSDLASALGATAAGAVANADLAFDTRHRAEQAPAQLRDQRLVEVATGIIAAGGAIDVQDARDRLLDAAARAGISQAQAAQVLINLYQG